MSKATDSAMDDARANDSPPAGHGPEGAADASTSSPAIAASLRDEAGANAGSRAQVSSFEVRYALAAVAAEMVLVLASVVAGLPTAAALVLHLFVIAGLAWALYQRRRDGADLSAPLLTLIAVSACGPVGAVIGLGALLWLSGRAQPSALLQAWYDRIAMSTTVDDETKLSDRVASGRVIDTAAPAPLALVGVIRTGTLEEIGVKPNVNYLVKVRNTDEAAAHHA